MDPVIMSELLYSFIRIDRADPSGLMFQLTKKMRDLISSGRLPSGYVLPSSRGMSRQLGVSRNTVTFAIEQLVAEGYLAVSQGRRPTVALQSANIDESLEKSSAGRNLSTPKLTKWAAELTKAPWPLAVPEPQIPFRHGRADNREFPHGTWARYLRRTARLQLEPEDGLLNRPELQRALCAHLVSHRGIRAEADQVILVPTAQAGLTLIARLTLGAGDIAWLESPGYNGARVVLEASGAQVHGVQLDGQGMAFDNQTTRPQLIFTTPSHQFPTGRLMTVNRRLELLRLAQIRNSWIIEDDYDGEFHYDERPIPSLQGLDDSDRVFYVGTFSKSTFADIRIGYIVAPPQLVEILLRAQRHDGQLASLHVQRALAQFIADGHFLAHIRKMRRLYQSRRNYLVEALERHVGEWFSVETPPGGMQLVAWCRKQDDDCRLCDQLSNAGVLARPLSPLFVGQPTRNGLLLGFAAWREAEIECAVVKLREILTCG